MSVLKINYLMKILLIDDLEKNKEIYISFEYAFKNKILLQNKKIMALKHILT